MKIIAAVMADFQETFLGAPARLLEKLADRAVLRHTLARLTRVAGLDGRCLVVRQRDADTAAEALRALELNQDIDLLTLDSGQRARRGMLQSARKWNLESWRGGLLGSTCFDEYFDAPTIARVMQHYTADAALILDAHHACFDPALATAMIAHQRSMREEAKFVFTQTPPGLAGLIVTPEALHDVLRMDIPFGLSLSYRPEISQLDPIIRPSCYHARADVTQTSYRFVADTSRACELISSAFESLGRDADAAQLCAWSRQPGNDRAGRLPLELELELTTDDPLPRTRLRLRGDRVRGRSLDDFDALGQRLAEFGHYDDRLLFLDGHGDTLRHPQFGELCAMARGSGICGIGVATTGLPLTDAHVDAMIENRVDLIQIRLDAYSSETYREMHGDDQFAAAQASVDRLDRARRDRNSPQPLIVPSLMRCTATIGEVDSFFDHFIRAAGSAVIEGYNRYGQILPPDTLLTTEPPVRTACRRLATRLTLLADGAAARCHQDFDGADSLGNWRTTSLAELWQGPGRRALLDLHRRGEWVADARCGPCGEWHRM